MGNMKINNARHIEVASTRETQLMDTEELRQPVGEEVVLGAWEKSRADFFCQRRELGIINIGAKGTISVDGETFGMDYLDGLYIPRGKKEIRFASSDAGTPAKFYLLSYPAHKTTEMKHIPRASIKPLELGSGDSCNERKLYQVFHPGTIESCQLVMGYTSIAQGSAWNTFPPHTHERRSEVYCYFDMSDEALVFHLMGEPGETRHIVMRNEEAVFSPCWSIHAGAGTAPYSFIWGMGGENQDFTDMDACDLSKML